MTSFRSRIIKIIAVFCSGCIILISLVVLTFAIGIIYNEIRLAFLKEQTKKYAHPSDSQLLQTISIVGNFASASNQCGFIVAEVRKTGLKPDDIHMFYASILADASYDKGPPYREVNLYILTNKKDRENIELLYSEVYERSIYSTVTDDHSYLLLTAETGYPPNNDFRCH